MFNYLQQSINAGMKPNTKHSSYTCSAKTAGNFGLFIDKYSLNNKWMVISSLFFIACICLGFASFFALNQISSDIQTNVRESQKRSQVIDKAISSVHRMESSLIQLIAYSEKSSIREASIDSIKASSLLDESIQNLQLQLPKNHHAQQLKITLEDIKPKRLLLIKLAIHNNDAKAFAVVKLIAPQVKQISQYLSKIVHQDRQRFEAILNSLEMELAQSLQTFGLIVATAILLLFFINNRLISAKISVKKLNTELENKVQQRTEQLQASTIEAQQTLKALQKTQQHMLELEKMSSLTTLVAGVAHEINTPIGIGVTAISHLQKQNATFEKLYQDNNISHKAFTSHLEESKELTDMIQFNLQRASKLIHSFKQVSVDQSSEALRSFNLSEYLNEVIISLKVKLKNTRHTVCLDCCKEIVLLSYPGALSQIITNLIFNSLIHGFKQIQQGSIHIDVTASADQVTINYRDDGCGIERENLHQIYDPFYTTNRHSGSSGLGMNVVFNLVTQSLKGKISCNSEQGKGVKFTISLPLLHSDTQKE